MKLLIVTQTVDRNDPILGFFHRWIEEFSTRFERITVICLREGEHALPANVSVHSLGKERGSATPFAYASRFLALAWRLRGEYDAVFVHMNPEYVILAGAFWRMAGRRVGLWYNHIQGGIRLRLAALFSDIIFHTSPFAASAQFRQSRRMPAGIDTDVFAPQPRVAKKAGSIYFQGRIAPAKNVHILLDAFSRAKQGGGARILSLVGPEDASYAEPLKQRYGALITDGSLAFLGPKRNEETPALYAAHTVSVNLTARGNYDKSVLESLASGTPVIVSSDAFSDIVPHAWTVRCEASALASMLSDFLALPESERMEIARAGREAVVLKHGLGKLGAEVAAAFAREGKA
jgi:glycosyltransferase involved in cell wall biosynthesis